MASPSDIGAAHYQQRQQLAAAATEVAAKEWSKVDRRNLRESWLLRLPFLASILSAAQLGAARQAEPYVAEATAAQGLISAAQGLLSAAAFAGAASDGRELLSLLFQPVLATLRAIAGGASTDMAMATGAANLDMIVRTQVADAGRAADQVATTVTRDAEGYVRITVGDSCNRCIILAGRFYTWSEGFKRHPRCDCVMLPAAQARAASLIQDPQAIYERMTGEQRTAAGWSASEQDALNEGADIIQVTNSTTRKNSVYTAGGREFTREGVTRQGTFGGRDIDPETGKLIPRRRGTRGRRRLTVDQIYAEAKDRDDAIRLLRENAYLTGEPKAEPKAEVKPATQPSAPQPEPVNASRARQALIDDIRKKAEAMATLHEMMFNDPTPDEIRRRVEWLDRRDNFAADPVMAQLLLEDIVSITAFRRKLDDVAAQLGLTRIHGRLGLIRNKNGEFQVEVATSNLREHKPIGPYIEPGTEVLIVRPGYYIQLPGEERLVLIKAIVEESDGDDIIFGDDPETGEPGAVEAIRELERELAQLAGSGAGNKQVRQRAHQMLTEVLEKLGGLTELADEEDEIREWIDESTPDAIVSLFRGFAEDAEQAAMDPADRPAAWHIGELMAWDPFHAEKRQEETKRIVEEKLNGEYAGLTVKVTQVGADRNLLAVSAEIFKDGRKVGEVERHFGRAFDPDNQPVLSAYHDFLELRPDVQGQGFAEAWNGHLEQWYRDSGVGNIFVGANIDVGGYAWARHGFDFRTEQTAAGIAARLKWRLTEHAERYDAAQIAAGQEMLDRMRLDFSDPRFPTAFEVSQAGRKPGQGRDGYWPGKDAMLGSSWDGVKPVLP